MSFLYRPDRAEPAPLRWLGDAIDVAVTLLAATLLIVMFANVAARVALNSDIAWNTEFGEFVLLWATFLGGASAARRGAHMRITEFVDSFPPAIGHAVELATRVGVVGLLLLLIWYGLSISESTMGQEMTVLHWPIGVQYLAMPVGSAFALVFVIYETVLLAMGRPIPQEAFQD
ncbi:TRAP transporter small permease [Bosea sp. BK604]|uniref:TRAP transporter small permease n=1 Tax=Bosea sp. BK604 TaxID=2512180 RepID=UPI001048B319|nr:TRAP transporter small permease [Bosea sp. BK604]TCR68525.1 TRAP-type C4-dicarboxylate transport system permease small subunit [Bosea sp. BK604]